jgi:hypothetical protein
VGNLLQAFHLLEEQTLVPGAELLFDVFDRDVDVLLEVLGVRDDSVRTITEPACNLIPLH